MQVGTGSQAAIAITEGHLSLGPQTPTRFCTSGSRRRTMRDR